MLFIKARNTNSEDQLKSDFGEYPPKPLNPKKLKNNFDVVYMGSLARIPYAVKILFYTLANKSSVDHPDFEDMRQSILKLKDSNQAIVTQLNSSRFYVSWILFIVFLILFLPLLVLLCFIAFVFFLNKFIRGRAFKGLGHFLSFPNRPSQIVIFPNALKKGNYKESEMTADGIISHEHIHLMQKVCFPERFVNKFIGENGNFLKSLLSNPERDFDFCSYHFLPDEMEARLHEVILSYYRKYEELPLDFYGFISLLLGSRTPNGNDALSKMAAMFVNNDEIEPSSLNTNHFDVRCELAEIEMSFAIMKLADPIKFIREALPVMYGNLLILYGDINGAKKYFETVGPCELYNEMYGEIIIPS